MENLMEYVKKNKIFLIVMAILVVGGVVGLKLKANRKRGKLGARPSASAPGLPAGGPAGKAGSSMVAPTVPMDALKPKDIKGGGKGLEEIGSLDIQNKELILKRIKVGFHYDYLSRFNPYIDWRARLDQKGPDLIGTRMISDGQQQGGGPSADTPSTAVSGGGLGDGQGSSGPRGPSMAALSSDGRQTMGSGLMQPASDIDFYGDDSGTTAGKQASTITLLYKGLFGLSRNKIAIIKEKTDVGESVELKTEGEMLAISGLVVQTIDSEKIVLLNPRDGSLQELLLATVPEPETEEAEQAEKEIEVE